MVHVCLFRFVEVWLNAPGGATLAFSTDLPGDALAVRSTVTIPPTTGRHPFRAPLPGSTKGKLYQITVTPLGSSSVSLYRAAVYARLLGPQTSAWAWYAVPGLFETQEDWQSIKLPIEPTPDNFTQIKLPIESTPDEWTQVKFPIETTPDEWTQVKLPIEATPDNWTQVKLPIESTPDNWSQVALPVKETPVVPSWVPVQVDE